MPARCAGGYVCGWGITGLFLRHLHRTCRRQTLLQGLAKVAALLPGHQPESTPQDVAPAIVGAARPELVLALRSICSSWRGCSAGCCALLAGARGSSVGRRVVRHCRLRFGAREMGMHGGEDVTPGGRRQAAAGMVAAFGAEACDAAAAAGVSQTCSAQLLAQHITVGISLTHIIRFSAPTKV